MKPQNIFISFALLVFALSPSLQQAQAQAPLPLHSRARQLASGSGGQIVFLPMVVNGQAPAADSYALIDQDVAAGKISAEQGLVYKVYALFSDAQLPKAYVGNGTLPRESESIMEEVVDQAGSQAGADPFLRPAE